MKPLKTEDLTFDENPINLPQGLEFSKGESNKQLIRAAWAEAGIKPAYPLDTREAFAMLRIIGYEANRARMDYCLARQYMPPPPKEGYGFAWREQDLVNFADALESLRAFVPLHPCHVHKLSKNELTKATVEAARRKAAHEAFMSMTFNELVGLMVNCEDLPTRELMGNALMFKTGAVHVKGKQKVPKHQP
jgi:hypothetical protein